MLRKTPFLVLAVALGACGPSSEERAAAEQAVAEAQERAAQDTVDMAMAAFDPSHFDTITWKSDQEAFDRGRVVFNFSCSKCHGAGGAGDGGFVMDGDTVRPPSFLEGDWRFAADLTGLRRQVFTGTAQGMPHWGLEGLKYRDIDAVAAYITRGLRTGRR